jgi:ribosome-binding factor A
MTESNRQRKVAQIIQEDLSELFRKQSAESTQSILISVSDVKVTADLGIAKIYLSLPKLYRSKNGKTSSGNSTTQFLFGHFIGRCGAN